MRERETREGGEKTGRDRDRQEEGDTEIDREMQEERNTEIEKFQVID